MSYENLKEAALAVLENIQMNDSSWGAWDDAEDILSAYEIEDNLSKEEKDILNRAIKTNGETIDADMIKAFSLEYWPNGDIQYNSWK